MDTTQHEAGNGRWQVGACRVDPGALTIDGPNGSTSIEPMVMDVLLILMANTGQVVERGTLIEAVWKAEYGADERLTRAISLLRKALGDAHGVRRAIETVPKRGYRLIADTWPIQDETAPLQTVEAIRQQNGHQPTRHRPKSWPAARTRLAAWALPVLGLAVAAGIGLTAILAPGDSPPAEDAAILAEPLVEVTAQGRVEIGAFTAATNDAAVEAVVRSLPANMTTILSRAGIETIAAGTSTSVRPEFEVRGQVEPDGDMQRGYVEVFDSTDGLVVWSNAFERRASDGRLADYMGASTAWILQCAFSIRGEATDIGSDTFRLYARFCQASREKAQMKNLPAFTSPILERQPDWSTALALHSFALSHQVEYSEEETAEERAAMLQAATALADRAIEAQPDNAYAHLAQSTVKAVNGDQLGVMDHLEKAVAARRVPPHAIASLAYEYRRRGRISEAQTLLSRSLAIDPYDVYARTQLAMLLGIRGDRAAAHRQFDRVARDNPDWYELYWRKLQLELFDGDAQEGLDYLDIVEARGTPIAEHLLACARAFGEARIADAPDLDAFAAVCDDGVQADWRARMYAALGDLDQAYAAMDEFPKDMASVTVVFFYPEMEAFREDGRFWPMAAQFGLVDYWLETDAWPDFCGDERLDYDCRRRARIAQRSTTIQ